MYNHKVSSFWVKIWCLALLLFFCYQCNAQNPPQKVNAVYQFKGVGTQDSVPLTSVLFNNTYNLFSGDASFFFNPSTKLTTDKLHQVGSGVPNHSALLGIRSPSVSSFRVNYPSLQGDTATHTPTSDYNVTEDESFVNSDGQRDNVWQFGYNNNGTGGSIKSNEAAMWDSWESHFIPFPGFPDNFEKHFEVKYKNGVNKRLWSYTIKKDSAGSANLDWRIDNFDVHPTTDENVNTFAYNSGGNFIMSGSAAAGGSQLTIQDSSFPTPSCKLQIEVQTAGVFYNTFGIPKYFEDAQARFGGTIPQPIFITDRFNSNNSTIFIDPQSAGLKDIIHCEGPVDGGMNILVNNTSTVIGASSQLALSTSGKNVSSIALNNLTTGNNVFFVNDSAGDWAIENSIAHLGGIHFIECTANGNFSIDSSSQPSAQLTMSSTISGFLPPRMTSVQRLAIPSPAEGLQVYDLTLHHPFYFNGTIWVSL